jgi:hypothetical protein
MWVGCHNVRSDVENTPINISWACLHTHGVNNYVENKASVCFP